MSVIVDDSFIRLSGRCLADDAEALLQALAENPGRTVEVGGAQKLHLAVVQVLLIAGPVIEGMPDNPFLAQHVLKLLQ